MSEPGQFSIRPIRKFSDDPVVMDKKTKQRALLLIQQGYSPDRDGKTVRKLAR